MFGFGKKREKAKKDLVASLRDELKEQDNTIEQKDISIKALQTANESLHETCERLTAEKKKLEDKLGRQEAVASVFVKEIDRLGVVVKLTNELGRRPSEEEINARLLYNAGPVLNYVSGLVTQPFWDDDRGKVQNPYGRESW